jgi:outer membrane protein assembly factor BamB
MLVIATLDGIFSFEAYYQDMSNYSIGNHLWHLALTGLVSSPAIDRGLIFIGSEDKHLYAIEYGGKKVSVYWKYKTRGAIRMKPYLSKHRNLVLFGSHDGNVYCLNRKTSKLYWPRFIGAAVNSNIISKTDGHKEYFFFGGDNGVFYCLDGQGEIIWEFTANGKIRSEAAIHKDVVYFGCDDNQLYALNTKTGEKKFQFSTDGNINGRPVVIDDAVYFCSTDSFVYGVNI